MFESNLILNVTDGFSSGGAKIPWIQVLRTKSRMRFEIVSESIDSTNCRSLPRILATSFLSSPYLIYSLKKSISAPVNLFLYLGQDPLHCGRGHESIRWCAQLLF